MPAKCVCRKCVLVLEWLCQCTLLFLFDAALVCFMCLLVMPAGC